MKKWNSFSPHHARPQFLGPNPCKRLRNSGPGDGRGKTLSPQKHRAISSSKRRNRSTVILDGAEVALKVASFIWRCSAKSWKAFFFEQLRGETVCELANMVIGNSVNTYETIRVSIQSVPAKATSRETLPRTLWAAPTTESHGHLHRGRPAGRSTSISAMHYLHRTPGPRREDPHHP